MKILCLLILMLVSMSYCKIRLYSPSAKRSDFHAKSGEEGTIDYSIGMMGNIDYRDKYLVELKLYPVEEACNSVNFNTSEHYSNQKIAYLVKRGTCTFSEKVHNVALSGGDLAIIYDDDPKDDIFTIVPIQDKKNKKQNIPMILITKKDGENLIETINSTTQKRAVLSVDFDSAALTEKPNVRFWMAVTDKNSFNFLLDFQPYYNFLAPEINFIPAYRFHKRDKLDYLEQFTTKKHCYSNGAYCVAKAAMVLNRPLDFIDEALRQICVFKLDKTPRKTDWFNYIKRFKTLCLDNLSAEFNLKEECYNKILKEQGVFEKNYGTPVDTCVKDSWVTTGTIQIKPSEQENHQLQESIPELMYRDIYVVPAVLINDFMYRGEIEGFSVATSICDSFAEKKEGCVNIKTRAATEHKNPIHYKRPTQDTYIVHITVGVILFMIILSLVVMVFMKIHFSKKVNMQISSIVDTSVGDYIKLKDREAAEKK